MTEGPGRQMFLLASCLMLPVFIQVNSGVTDALKSSPG